MSDLIPSNQNNLIVLDLPQLDQNPAAVYLAGLAKGSRPAMGQALATIAELLTGSPDYLRCNWAALRFQHTAAVRSALAGRYNFSTANKMLSALRGVLRAAWQLGQLGADDYQLAQSVKGVDGESTLTGRQLSTGEIAALIAACEADPSPAGVRDAAIIGLMYGGGPRRQEVIDLDLSDYDQAAGALTVRHGKGNKARSIYVLNGAGRAINDWLKVRGLAAGPLFQPISKGGKVQPRRMTGQALYSLLKKRAAQAGVSVFSPHDLRRSFVSDLLDAGADIATVARMAGHKSVNTTLRYDRRPEEAKQRASKMLHVPYHGRQP